MVKVTFRNVFTMQVTTVDYKDYWLHTLFWVVTSCNPLKMNVAEIEIFYPPTPWISFFEEKNDKCLELPDLVRKLVRKIF